MEQKSCLGANVQNTHAWKRTYEITPWCLKICRSAENKLERKAGVAERNDISIRCKWIWLFTVFTQKEYRATPDPFQRNWKTHMKGVSTPEGEPPKCWWAIGLHVAGPPEYHTSLRHLHNVPALSLLLYPSVNLLLLQSI